jgi:tol-pal system protein YbgF
MDAEIRHGRECMKRTILFCLLIALMSAGPSARAGTKEDLMRLSADVLALQNQLRELDKAYSEKIEGLRSLVVQLNDQVAKTNMLVNKVSAALDNQASGGRSNDQALLQEIRAISTKMDDSATRISALAQQIVDLKVQAKSINPEPAGSASQGFSADALFGQANQDLALGNFGLATEEFTDYLKRFPAGSMAAAAQNSIGEAYYSQNKLPEAIAAFSRVITDYPSSDKVATALFKRGRARLAMKDNENAISDFRNVIKTYPTAPESDLAKIEIQTLGAGADKPKPPVRKTR